MKLLLVICAFVACVSAAAVYKITSHLDVTKELVGLSDAKPLDFLESNEIEELMSNDEENELTKKRKKDNLCRLCHQVVGFTIGHTHNRTSRQSVVRTLNNVCRHVHVERRACQSFVGNYSRSITNMIVANRTSYQICNKLRVCKSNNDGEIYQILNTPQQTHLLLNNAESNEDFEEIQNEKDGEVDQSQINTGSVEPDYGFHENRVGNDDSHDDDNNEQFHISLWVN